MDTETKNQILEHPIWSYDAVIYEMNIRQQTADGTLRAAAERLPLLKSVGIDAVWLMPVYPIGKAGRKGSSGSYYSVRDYCAVNPEFGTMEDFDAFVAEAHRLGMKVLLDWVRQPHVARRRVAHRKTVRAGMSETSAAKRKYLGIGATRRN